MPTVREPGILTRMRRLLAALCAAALALAAGTAGAAPATTTGTGVTTVRLSITVETTSDWTKVLLAPGRFEASKVREISPGATLISGSQGWELRPLAGRGTLTVDAVFDEASTAAAYVLEVQKGAIGETTVTVRNTTGAPMPPVVVTNTTSSATDPTNNVRTRLGSSALMGATQLALPRADDRRLTLAFYYPWFGSGYGERTLADRPTRPRSTADAAGVRSMTEQARAHGVDGFLVSWAGERRDGAEYDLVVAAAEQTRGVVAPYLETTQAAAEAAATGRPVVAVVRQWLAEALQRSVSRAALTAGAAAVVFVWDADQLSPQEWSVLLREAELRGTPVRLVTDAPQREYAEVSWGLHRYTVNEDLRTLAAEHRSLSLRAHGPAALDDATAPRLYAATVSPGFDDTALRGSTNPVVPRGPAGERYTGSWRAATSSRPDWVLVNSWNEWFEATSIEPGVETGDRALQQTKEQARTWRSSR